MTTRSITAAARAYQRLRDEILDGTLAPGDPLLEVAQSQRLGVSRTPVREAFALLVNDGLATPTGGRGLVVTDLDPSEAASIFEMRATLEPQAAKLAAQRGQTEVFEGFAAEFAAWHAALAGDPAQIAVDSYFETIARFDRAITEAAANRYLAQALETLNTHTARLRRQSSASLARISASAAEHALIASAIANGDPDLAVHATHIHLHASREHYGRIAASAQSDER
ncbi:DNA-binding GntR family transcriptional regulator [Kineosphaera limosa]|uniref:Putative GntR family transcriptional regulator n=1 Tax=Kineosphaera limosa NBRC 100340 TaxID=1184609 RepID=K6W6Y7_9MICO|nr:GntR family transcriptional regulator [Kineosphaera limosa]NYE00574.1 DNA-binding GntR family transcriptional regulator [Kineosphaera limosa]GAB94960.1 putative GntR family transcriptional regulator [Kineosphaera limosa NBRC 100340]